MKISGFTYLRNAIKYGYPFLASIKSLLPIVDELIVVVGSSEDGSREAIENLNNHKIKIIDTVWDDTLRENGKVFSQQADIGLKHITGEWAFHLQVDEVLHHEAKNKILTAIEKVDSKNNIDGIIFPFLHFWGDYKHIRNTRRTHRYEIRAFKNTGDIASYKDSQGFRRNNKKLKVIKSDTFIFHYSYTRHPRLMKKKDNYFHRFWHNDQWLKENTSQAEFDYNKVDKLEEFHGSHPVYMKKAIEAQDWEFRYDPSQSVIKFKDKILNSFEKLTGIRMFEYRNYKIAGRQ